MIEHEIIIRSLHDAMAECKCGTWHYYFTGESTISEINNEWLKHIANTNLLKETRNETNMLHL